MALSVFLSIFTLVFALTADANVARRFPRTSRFSNGHITPLIVGGRPALQGEIPYIVDIRIEWNGKVEHWCAANLVEVNGLQVGISTASCVYGPAQYAPFEVVAGDINQAVTSGLEQIRSVSKAVPHPRYNDWTFVNDISVVFFNESFQINENVKTVRLPEQGHVLSGRSVKVAGWGDTVDEYGNNPSDELRIVGLPLLNDTYCVETYQDWIVKTDENMFCAGSSIGGSGHCPGDAGGPGITDDGYLAGIVTWGFNCGANPAYPSVFTKVGNYVDWIHETVEDYQNSLK